MLFIIKWLFGWFVWIIALGVEAVVLTILIGVIALGLIRG
jgi:hypothetical protein